MKAIVTGATGFLGRAMVQELINNGMDVIAIVRNLFKVPDTWKNNKHLTIVECDMSELKNFMNLGSNVDTSDYFFHFAWSGTSGMERADIDLQLENVKNTCEAVELANKLQCKCFINAGSIMEYEAMDFISRENSKPGIGNIYNTAKLTADFMAKTVANKLNLKYINIIISNIYGTGELSQRFLNTTLKKMMRNDTIELTHGKQLYDFIYITDAVNAICKVALDGEPNQSYYIGNSTQRPLKDFVIEMKNVINSSSELNFGKVPFNGSMLTYKEFDTYKLKNVIGFNPKIDFETGVIKTMEWIKEDNNEF